MGHDDYDDDYGDDDRGYDEPKKGPKVVLIILGVCLAVFILGGGICALLLMPALSQAKARANQTRCANNLRQIGLAGIQYADDKRFYPSSPDGDTNSVLLALQQSGYIDNLQHLTCPDAEGGASYEGFAAGYSNNVRSKTVIAWDAVPHVNKGQEFRNVLKADCSVEFMSEENFQIAKQKHDAYVEKLLAERAAGRQSR